MRDFALAADRLQANLHLEDTLRDDSAIDQAEREANEAFDRLLAERGLAVPPSR
ncbi:hypothetical protein [Nocardioides zeae]